MSELDPKQYVNMMRYSATYLLEQHMNPSSFESTWEKFVLSANKWLKKNGFAEYNKVDLANMRGGRGSATSNILANLGHKGCRVADLIGILEDAEMYDIVEAEEFKLRTPCKTVRDKRRHSEPQGATRTVLTNTDSSVTKSYHRRLTMPVTVERENEDSENDASGDDDDEYATASSGGEGEEGVSSHASDTNSGPGNHVILVTTKKGSKKRPSSGKRASHSKRTSDGAAALLTSRQDSFISEMSSKSIVLELKRKKVISEDVANKIEKSSSEAEANEALYAHLESQARKKELKTVFDCASSKKGLPRMNSFAEEMLGQLQ